MEWTLNREEEGLVEWTRADGYATIRCRQRADGEWVVRLDRLYQAPDGSGYRRERVGDVDAAKRVAEAWRDEHDGETGDGGS